jgi:hypothetical protein
VGGSAWRAIVVVLTRKQRWRGEENGGIDASKNRGDEIAYLSADEANVCERNEEAWEHARAEIEVRLGFRRAKNAVRQLETRETRD